MHCACSEDKEAGPDKAQCPKHFGYSRSHFIWEELLLSALYDDSLDSNIVRIAQLVDDQAKDEASKAKSADDEAGCQAKSPLEMAPSGLQGG